MAANRPADAPGRSANSSIKKYEQLLALLTDLADAHPTDPERVAEAACRKAGCRFETLRDSLVWALSAEDKARALKRIAGNRDALAAGRPVLETLPRDTAGWGAAQVISVDSVYRTNFRTRKRERTLEVKVRAITGPPCPDVFTQIMKPNFLRYIAKQIGFTRASGRRPLVDDREVSGLRVLALFVPVDGRVRMDKFDLPSALRKWNVELLTDRLRADPRRFACPLNLTPDVACWQCTAGRDRCAAACRPKTLQRRTCACVREFWFDPARPDENECPSCLSKRERK